MSDGRYDSYVLAHEERRNAEAEVARLREELAAAKAGKSECIDDDGTPFASARTWRAANAEAGRDLAAARRSLEEARAERDHARRRAVEYSAEADGFRQSLEAIADDTDADGFELRQRARAFLAPPAATPPPREPCRRCSHPTHYGVCGFMDGPVMMCMCNAGHNADAEPDAAAPRNPDKPCETCGSANGLIDNQGMRRPCPTCTHGAKP